MRETRRRGAILSIIALGLAILTGFLAFNYINGLEREIGDRQRVVVAAEDIPSRTLLTPDILEIQEIPRQYVHNSYVLSISDIVSNSISIVDIQEGQILQRNMLDPQAGLQPLRRAISIAVNQETSVGGNVRAGNRVDVLVSYSFGEVRRTEVLLQDVEVLAVNSLLPNSEEAAGVAPSRFLPNGEFISDATVTLSLNLEDAERLTFMSNFADEVRLVIRRPDESGEQQLDPITEEEFD